MLQEGDTRCHQLHCVGQSGDTKIDRDGEGTLLHLTLGTLCTLSVWTPSLTVVSKVFISLSKEDVKYTGK